MASAAEIQPHEIGQVLMLARQDFQQRLDTDLKHRGVRGISPRQQAVFLHLGRFGASRSVDLASAAGIRPQSMMKIVHELEELKLVERRPDPSDSRAKLVDFTPRGRDFIDELSASTLTVWQQYRDGVGTEQLQQALTTLSVMSSLPHDPTRS